MTRHFISLFFDEAKRKEMYLLLKGTSVIQERQAKARVDA